MKLDTILVYIIIVVEWVGKRLDPSKSQPTSVSAPVNIQNGAINKRISLFVFFFYIQQVIITTYMCVKTGCLSNINCIVSAIDLKPRC